MIFRAAYLAALFCITSPAWATADEDGEVRSNFGAHHGYVSDVRDEKTKRDIEMVMLPQAKEEKKNLVKKIFNEKLTKEFQAQYQYRFGTTEVEQVINNPSRDGEYTFYNRQSIGIQEYQKQQQQFGNYMTRRLTEYHVDAWAKSDPDFRPIYQAKDKFSNLDVQMKKGYKFKWKYNFAGPSMEMKVENPYDIETKAQIMMNGVVSLPAETIYSLGYNLTPRLKVEALYREQRTLAQLILTRRLTRRLSVYVTGSQGQLPTVPDINQSLALLGFSYSE